MNTEPQEEQTEILAEEWGVRLINARESLSLSVEQVATKLNLPASYIQQLEQCSLEGLPSLVFAKGYIRAYAKLLHLDDNLLVAEFETLHGVDSKGNIRPVSKVPEQVKMNDPVMKYSTWIMILAIIGVFVWWWQTQQGGISFSGTNDKAVAVVTANAEIQQQNPVVTLNNGTGQLVLPKLDDQPATEGGSQVVNAVQTETAEEVEPSYLSEEEIKKLQSAIDRNQAPVAQATAESTDQSIALKTVEGATQSQTALPVSDLTKATFSASFNNECWVTVKDANGKSLFNNLRGKGQSLKVSGKPPFKILIGAANAVNSVSFNGKVMDLAPHTRKNVVRMTLPVAE